MKKLLVFVFMIFTTVSYADTETINWYKDGTVYNTTTCQTGDYITFPTQPTKRGHNFVGWQVALYDFSTLDPSVGGTSYTYNKSNKTWAITFPYGLVSGEALCSITPGTYAVAGTPDESTSGGQNCWCKAATYKPTGSNIVYENTSSSDWAFNCSYGSTTTCASECVDYCGSLSRVSTPLRRALFGATQ